MIHSRYKIPASETRPPLPLPVRFFDPILSHSSYLHALGARNSDVAIVERARTRGRKVVTVAPRLGAGVARAERIKRARTLQQRFEIDIENEKTKKHDGGKRGQRGLRQPDQYRRRDDRQIGLR